MPDRIVKLHDIAWDAARARVRQVHFQDPDGHWIEVNDADSEP